jgi:tetratricopeptide (TPR) repeat protein
MTRKPLLLVLLTLTGSGPSPREAPPAAAPRSVAAVGPARPTAGAERATGEGASIAVLDFTTRAHPALAGGLAELLELELRQLGLKTLARRQLRFVLSERALARSGLVAPEDAIRQALPWVTYLVKGHLEVGSGSALELRVSLVNARAGSTVAEFSETLQHLGDPVGSVRSLARRLGGSVDPATGPGAEHPRPPGTSAIPEVVLRLHRGLDAYFGGRPEVAVVHFRQVSEIDPDCVVARIWEARAYEALGLHKHARLVHEMLRVEQPGMRAEGLDEMRQGLGSTVVAIVNGNGEPSLSHAVASELTNRIAATDGLRAFRGDWIQGLTDEMDLELTGEFVSPSALRHRSWLFVDLIASPSVWREGTLVRVRVDILRAQTGEIVRRLERAVPSGAADQPGWARGIVEEAVQACRGPAAGAGLPLAPAPSAEARAASPTEEMLAWRPRRFAERLLDHARHPTDKRRLMRLFHAYPDGVEWLHWFKAGQTQFLHQALLIRELLTLVDEDDPEAPDWLSTALWIDRSLRLEHGACRSDEREECSNARRLLEVLDREWPPPSPFTYRPWTDAEMVAASEGLTAPGEPLGRGFAVLAGKYPRSQAAALADYPLAIDHMNRGDHAAAFALLQRLAERLPSAGAHEPSPRFWVSFYYFAAREASRVGRREAAQSYLDQAFLWLAKFDLLSRPGGELGETSRLPVEAMTALAIYSAPVAEGPGDWKAAPPATALGIDGPDDLRVRLPNGELVKGRYDLRPELMALRGELRRGDQPGRARATDALERTADAVPTPLAATRLSSGSAVAAVLRLLCDCRIEERGGGPDETDVLRAIRETRRRTRDPQVIETLRVIGRRYLELQASRPGASSSPRRKFEAAAIAAGQRMRATQVLLATQDVEALSRLADGWLSSREPQERLAGVIARGRLLLYEGRPPAVSDYYTIEPPIRGTEGRRQQAEFYSRELQRWVAELGHPLETGRYDPTFFDFALRTAYTFKLAGLPARALPIYALALREPRTPPARDSARLARGLLEIRYRHAVLLAELGDRAGAAAHLKTLIEGDPQRNKYLEEETDWLLVDGSNADGLLYDAAVKSLQGLRTAP